MNINDCFRDARILYFDAAPSYYALSIKKSIEKQGGSVDFFTFDDKKLLTKILDKTCKSMCLQNKYGFLKDCLNRIKNNQYDFLFIKSAHEAPVQFIEELSNVFHKAHKVSYHWNSIKLFNYIDYLKYFDRNFSFDPDDCNRYNLIYYPLFFIDEYRDAREEISNFPKDIDLVFIGSGISEGRHNFLKRLENYCIQKKIKNYFYLFASRFNAFKAFVKGKYIPNVQHKYLTHKEIIDIYKKSKAVIDYPMDIQSGFTMRTFETLGSGLKLITTNKRVKNTDFYDEHSIQCIDSINDIDINFIQDKERRIINNIDDYHIDQWIQQVLTP